eukprot:TRINITY_DN5267_c0_g2_i3.p1 TRINITY_DN5267_c0_g2~~TRINITY_DN5267_c0_g2_i3.p1  ORF type:complete len:364 (+),score=105.83 TRINITY_DN5267_c0_g2_i3:111-1202(+)
MDDLVPIIRSSIQFKTCKTGMFSKVENVFSGEDLIDWFRKKFNLTNEEVIANVCNDMLEQAIIHAVNAPNNTTEFDRSSKIFYRFQMDKPDIGANQLKIWNREVRPPIQVSTELVTKMNDLLKELAANPSADADFLNSSQSYSRFVDAICELQRVTTFSLSKPEKTVFYLNIYQVMHAHLLVRELVGGTASKSGGGLVSRFIGKGSGTEFYYNVGGLNFTVEELRSGILRSNKRSPNGSFKGFSSSDQRLQQHQVRDPRVVCVFLRESTIPTNLTAFNPANLEDMLDKICKDLINSTVIWDPVESELSLPKVFETFKEDLGKTPGEIVKWITKYSNPRTIENPAEVIRGVNDNQISLSYNNDN